MKKNPILNHKPIGFQWPVENPFIFCAHHSDFYPKGNGSLGPQASLEGRNIGQDFDPDLPWRMYHGYNIPGFPVHPHRGFETVTIVTKGIVDHSDSYGQAGRYGGGDVQWMTAGSGLQHSEMFPLIQTEQSNEMELFQVWLNLPASKKMAEPHFKMLWAEEIPLLKLQDKEGKNTTIKLIAGKYLDQKALEPAPDSWASNPDNEVNIWLIKMEAGAEWEIPVSNNEVNRWLYFYEGDSIRINEFSFNNKNAFKLDASSMVTISSVDKDSYFVLLQGQPIGEPIAQYGPFVMNTQNELRQAFYDYERTQFGGWPWPQKDMVHGTTKGRFAKYKDGTLIDKG